MDRRVLWRAAAVQATTVAALALVLGFALPRSFFLDWGWLAGPAAWFVCAAVTALFLRLAVGPALAGAALAGLPALLAVLVGVHWLGTVLAVAVFAAWCARFAARRRSALG